MARAAPSGPTSRARDRRKSRLRSTSRSAQRRGKDTHPGVPPSIEGVGIGGAMEPVDIVLWSSCGRISIAPATPTAPAMTCLSPRCSRSRPQPRSRKPILLWDRRDVRQDVFLGSHPSSSARFAESLSRALNRPWMVRRQCTIVPGWPACAWPARRHPGSGQGSQSGFTISVKTGREPAPGGRA